MVDKRTSLTPTKLKKRVAALHTCPLCNARLPSGRKLDHFKAVHPEYKISRHRVDKDHTGYKCGLCGILLSNFRQVIDHYASTHPLSEIDVTPGQAWLDELLTRLEQRKALLKENKRLTEENERVKKMNAELTQKLVRFQRLMAQPD